MGGRGLGVGEEQRFLLRTGAKCRFCFSTWLPLERPVHGTLGLLCHWGELGQTLALIERTGRDTSYLLLDRSFVRAFRCC